MRRVSVGRPRDTLRVRPRKGSYFPLAEVRGGGALTLLWAFNDKVRKLNYITLGAPSGSDTCENLG